MSNSLILELQLGLQFDDHAPARSRENLESCLPVDCPFCGVTMLRPHTWGSYETLTGSVTRLICDRCRRTFNPAKLPYWQTKVPAIVWKLGQLLIQDRLSISFLAKMWGVPESTLRTLTVTIKEFLAANLERAKQLQELLTPRNTRETSPLRIIFYDEGFLKLLGTTGYIIFTLASDGTPLTVAIEPQRDAETIHGHFVQAITQLGGVDVIVGDGAPAILKAAKALRQPLILIQHIHTKTGKRARIIQLDPIPNRKGIWQTTLEIHTGSLLPNTESLITAVKKKVYPPNWTAISRKKSKSQLQKSTKSQPHSLTQVLTPTEEVNSPQEPPVRKPRLLKGHQLVLRTADLLYEMDLNYIFNNAEPASLDCPNLLQIYSMLAFVQQALPNQFITSNRAEVFNALHDRQNVYWGRKSHQHADRDLRAWLAMTFFPQGTRTLIQHHSWHFPYRLLTQLCPLMISNVIIR